MIHMLVFVLAANVWQYVLKLPVSSMTARHGGAPFKVIDTPFADLINLGLLGLVILISYFVYHYFESFFRDYFRASGTTPLTDEPGPLGCSGGVRRAPKA